MISPMQRIFVEINTTLLNGQRIVQQKSFELFTCTCIRIMKCQTKTILRFNDGMFLLNTFLYILILLFLSILYQCRNNSLAYLYSHSFCFNVQISGNVFIFEIKGKKFAKS